MTSVTPASTNGGTSMYHQVRRKEGEEMPLSPPEATKKGEREQSNKRSYKSSPYLTSTLEVLMVQQSNLLWTKLSRRPLLT
jgi:hypothetical protein